MPEIEPTNTSHQDHDSPWKEALELRFPEFLDLLFPKVYQLIDWTKPTEFLDKELQQILPTAENGRTYADKLVQVHLKNGQTTWVLIHVEVQGEPEQAFAERMFQYNYRIRDKYKKDVISLAVLSDTSPSFRPEVYEFKMGGCRILFEFPMIKLLDWKDRLDTLLSSENVFSLIVAAQLQAKLLKQPEQRLNAKIQLIRLLYERGYNKEQIIELLRLIDWMIRLPDNLEIKVRQTVDQIEEEQHMAYMTSMERLAMQEGKLEMALEMVRRFNVSVKEAAETASVSVNELIDYIKQSEKS